MIIFSCKGLGGKYFEWRVKGSAVPRVDDRIDDGGQYYHTVVDVYWRHEGFFWRRLVPVVVVREHDRAEENA